MNSRQVVLLFGIFTVQRHSVRHECLTLACLLVKRSWHTLCFVQSVQHCMTEEGPKGLKLCVDEVVCTLRLI